jgi:two-component system, LytTR family, sensor kinase
MRPPADRLLDLHGRDSDLPARATTGVGVSWPQALLAATILGLLSTMLAWQFSRISGRPHTQMSTIVVLNFSWWYLWALMAPLVVWLSQRFRFERGALFRAAAVHLPAVIACSWAHIAAMEGLHWWLAYVDGKPYAWWTEVKRAAVLYLDWEMMTYWAIVGLSHALLYYRESRIRAVRAAHLEAKLAEARLAALQQQLHPHFLFNTLHAIGSLMHKDVAAAERVLMQLSDLLRMTLDHMGQQEVPLEIELVALSRYVDIERTRFADRLTVTVDVAPETRDAQVPSLLLQPLVENAIKHGVTRRSGPGHIDISARRDGDKLLLEVRDDGAGLSESALVALQKGIGVSTTRARLECLFGADFRFEFHRLPQGLAVVVALPWRPLRSAGADDPRAACGEPVRAAGASAGAPPAGPDPVPHTWRTQP